MVWDLSSNFAGRHCLFAINSKCRRTLFGFFYFVAIFSLMASNARIKGLSFVFYALVVVPSLCFIFADKRILYGFSKRNILSLVLIIFSFISAAWAMNETEALRFSAKIFILSLSAGFFAHVSSCDFNYFMRISFFVFFVVVVGSVAVCLLFPGFGVLAFESVNGPLVNRWHGLAYHPNTLGSFCFMLSWLSIYQVKTSVGLLSKIFFVLVVLVAFGVSYWGAQSKTSSVVLIALVAFFVFYALFEATPVLFVLILFSFFVLASVVMVFYDFSGLGDLSGLLGRDATLTGRTRLWEIVISGIKEKTLIGWGFDDLGVFSRKFFGSKGSLSAHNGYLDILLRGGLFGGVVLGCLVLCMVASDLKAALGGCFVRFWILSYYIAMLMHNVTESTIFKAAVPWLFALILFNCKDRVVSQRER